jgi:hypothetical protein
MMEMSVLLLRLSVENERVRQLGGFTLLMGINLLTSTLSARGINFRSDDW